MRSTDKFRKQALILFFAVALFPALTVSALWYTISRGTPGSDLMTIGGIIAPIALLGILPAMILGIVFAIREISRGNFGYRTNFRPNSEFSDMAHDLNMIAETMQEMLSQKSGETETLTAERNKLRAVLDSMEEGVFAIDAHDRIMLFNKAAREITGRSLSDVAGQLSEKVLPLRRHGELVMARWLADRHVAKRELGEWRNLELYRSDGTTLYVDVRAIKVPDDPNGIRALVTFRDLTKSHNLEEMKVDFVALAAHELRTPLTAIKGYLDVLNLELGKNLTDQQRMYLDRSMTSAQQLSGVVNNLLNVSRIEHEELSLIFEPVDPRRLLSALAEDYKTEAKNANRKFSLKVPAHLPQVRVDLTGFNEVINNLVENAFHYTADGGQVTLQAEVVGKELEILVIDDGNGIPKEAIPKLFTKFYRVEGLHTTHGTGLGLYISKAIVEAHKGHIWVESEEGKGTTFGLRLPLYQAVAGKPKTRHNASSELMKGTHGWIKEHSIR
jgi:two-component system phosphate regulon sensor histidine kinase PhoR